MPQILFFPYYGPNRHSDRRVLECRMDFSKEKEGEFPRRKTDIQQVLLRNGMLNAGDIFPFEDGGDDRIRWYSSLFVQTALLFQRQTGHEADFFSVTRDPQRMQSIALVEHEDPEAAMAAIRLAVEVFSGKAESLKPVYRQFLSYSRGRALSLETKAVIRQAKLRDIPYLQLDRTPLTGCIDTGFRVRRNGLLNLGQGVNSQILDGTYCVTKTGKYLDALIRDPGQRSGLLNHLGLRVVRNDPGAGTTAMLLRLLVINGKITATTLSDGGSVAVVENVHDSLVQQVMKVAERVNYAPVLLTYRVSDVTRPLQKSEGIVGFDLGPDLGKLLGSETFGDHLLDTLCGELLDWLFPQPSAARIPMVAITGTNGKTTTSRMTRHIFSHRGFKTGLVCTDGIFLDQHQVSADDNGTFQGHARVLTSKLVNAAVLEAHHRGIAIHGFAFYKSDVAVCLNVTEEHLAKGEIETVEEMAGIKRALVERASKVAVLFADDPNCVDMIEHMTSERVCLVSLDSSAAQLASLGAGRRTDFCVLENIDGQSWIVLHQAGKRLPFMPVNEIPATFDGTARFNVSNAMHAAAACHYSGIETAAIRSALASFRADQRYSPGRINHFEGLPFKVIMDFAHNPDGVQKICEFIDLQHVKGRKIIAFAGLAKRPDELNRKIANTVCGHFDFYFCKDYEPSKPPKKRFTGPFMQKRLVEQGVPENATRVMTFGKEVVFEILESCEPGDLLLFLAGHSESVKVPGYIEEYKQALSQQSRTGG